MPYLRLSYPTVYRRPVHDGREIIVARRAFFLGDGLAAVTLQVFVVADLAILDELQVPGFIKDIRHDTPGCHTPETFKHPEGSLHIPGKFFV